MTIKELCQKEGFVFIEELENELVFQHETQKSLWIWVDVGGRVIAWKRPYISDMRPTSISVDLGVTLRSIKNIWEV
jgi:hypothetical protein